MNRLFVLVAVCAMCAVLAACNTLQGVGKDIKKAGEKIEEVAKK